MSLRLSTVPDIIKALSPLMENTKVSSSAASRSWKNDYLKARNPAEFLTQYLADLGSRIEWVKCDACGREVNALTQGGNCAWCADAIEAAIRLDRSNGDLIVRSIGRYGVDFYNFQSFKVNFDNHAALQLAKAFDPARDNVYLWGPCGTGKTHLAGAMFKKAAGLGKTIKWTNPIYLARGCRVRFAQEEEAFIQAIAASEVLVIDDLGVGRDVHAILQAVYEIMELRRNAKRSGLIITSNHPVEELARKYGDDRFSSRVVGLCHVVKVGGVDHRLEPTL